MSETETRTLIYRPWRTSRGQETYGYNLLSAYDTRTDKSYRAMGGGYDMTGTVFGEWASDVLQTELRALYTADLPNYVDGGHTLYGMRRLSDCSVHIDGGTGFSNVEQLVKMTGATVHVVYGRRYVHSVQIMWTPSA